MDRPDLENRPINLELGDPGYPPPPGVRAMVARALANEGMAWSYEPPEGRQKLRSLIAKQMSEREGVTLDSSSVVVTAGASVALAAVILAATSPGDEVLCPDPGYPAFAGLTTRLGRCPVRYPMTGPGGHAEPAAVAAAISDRTSLLVWNTPSNPLGTIAPAAATAAIAALARERDLAILSDEVYEALVFDGRHTSPLSLAPDHCYSVHSFSKTFGMAGWRVGYVVTTPEHAARVAGAHWSVAMSASSAAQLAALGALRDADYVTRLRLTLLRRRDALSAILRRYDVPHRRPDAGFFFWLDIRGSGISSTEFVSRCATDAWVLVSAGTNYGPAGEGFVRLSFGGDDADAVEGTERVGRVYQTLRLARRKVEATG